MRTTCRCTESRPDSRNPPVDVLTSSTVRHVAVQSWTDFNVVQSRTSAVTVDAVTDDLVAVRGDGLPASEFTSRLEASDFLRRCPRRDSKLRTSTIAFASSSRTINPSSSVTPPASRPPPAASSTCRCADQTASSGPLTRRSPCRPRNAGCLATCHAVSRVHNFEPLSL